MSDSREIPTRDRIMVLLSPPSQEVFLTVEDARWIKDEIERLTAMLDHQALGPTLAKWQGVRAENERLTAERQADAQKQWDAACAVYKAENQRLRAALELVVESEYCSDGYRNVSISEEAMRAAREALQGDSDE